MNWAQAKDEIVKWLVPALLAMLWSEQRSNTQAIFEVAKIQASMIARMENAEQRANRQMDAIVKIQDTSNARAPLISEFREANSRQDQRLDRLEIKVFRKIVTF